MLSDDIRAQTDEHAIGALVTRRLAEHARLDRCYLARLYEDEDRVAVGPEFHAAGLAPASGDYRLSDFPEVVHRVRGRTVVIGDVASEPALTAADRSALGAIALGSFIAAGVRLGEKRVLWALVAASATPRAWTPGEVALAESLAERTWAAVQRIRAEERHRTELVHEVATRTAELAESRDLLGAIINASTDMIQVFEAVRDASGEIADFRWILNNQTSESIYGEICGESLLERKPGVVAEGIFGDFKRVVETGAPVQAERHYVHEQFNGWFLQSIVKLNDGVATTTKDITSWKTAQRELLRLNEEVAASRLRESEERFRQFAESSADVLWIVDADTRQLEYLSPAYERVWGEPRDAVMADLGHWARQIVPEDLPPGGAGIDALLEGKTYTAEYRIRLTSGGTRYIRDTGFPILDESGRVRRVAGIAQDITQEREAQLALATSEEKFRLIVENARDYAIIISDPDDIIVEWLPGAEAIFGWTREEAIGRPAAITFTPEDRKTGAPAAEIEAAARDGVAPDVRWHQRKDGGHVFIDGTVTPLRNADGSIRAFLKIGQDMSERRAAQEALEASERRMRSLVTGIPQMVFRSWGSGERIWGSPQWISYTGLGFEESLAFGWLDAVHPQDRQASIDGWEGVEQRGEYYVEHRIMNAATAEYRWHQTRATPSRASDGRVLEWLGTSNDIEEMRQLHRHQQILLAELQHRVRNTLGVVRSIARRTAELSADKDELASHLQGRLAAFSRVQAAVTRTPAGGVDLKGIVDDELVAHAARESEAVTVKGPALWLKPRPAESLSLAVHELASNAVKYGALGSDRGRLSVRWQVVRRGEQSVLGLVWEETGMELTEQPTRRGFGMELLERTLPHELDASTSAEFLPTGFRFTMEIPLANLAVET
jgi:PAS domain S-box-containing protein